MTCISLYKAINPGAISLSSLVFQYLVISITFCCCCIDKVLKNTTELLSFHFLYLYGWNLDLNHCGTDWLALDSGWNYFICCIQVLILAHFKIDDGYFIFPVIFFCWYVLWSICLSVYQSLHRQIFLLLPGAPSVGHSFIFNSITLWVALLLMHTLSFLQ